VFRRSALAGPVVDEAIPLRPKLIILQLGVIDRDAAQRAGAAGVPFLMDHCLAIEHRRLGL
jgi:predicted CoA-binding protein